MAEFCLQCSEELWGKGTTSDFAGIVAKGCYAKVLCEGCGELIIVNHMGKRVCLNDNDMDDD